MKYKKVCSHCKSENVLFDAYAEWNEEEQKFELVEVYDKGHYCEDCDGECSIENIEIEES